MRNSFGCVIKIFAVCMAAAFIPGLPAVSAAEYYEAPQEAREGYEKAAESSSHALYMAPLTGRFYVIKKSTGEIWHSAPAEADESGNIKRAVKNTLLSALQITYLNEDSSLMSGNSNSLSVNKNGLKTKKTKDGFEASYEFPEQGFLIPVRYRLEGGRVLVSVDTKEIRENGPHRLFSLALLPYFGAGSDMDQGFMFVPDGSGAIIQFNNGKGHLAQYSRPVYGENHSLYKYSQVTVEKNNSLPVFGIKNPRQAAVCVISSGEADADISANVSGSVNTYNNACAQFNLRVKDLLVYTDEARTDVDIFQKTAIADKKLEVTLLLLDSAADYSAMAGAYRDYLVERYGLQRKSGDGTPFYLDVYHATIRRKAFLGFPVNQIEALTGYGDAAEIFQRLQEKGVENIVMRLNNWSNETVWGRPLKHSGAIGGLGGGRGLKKLLKAARENGVTVAANGNLLTLRAGSNPFSYFYEFAQNIRKSPFKTYPYKLSTYNQDSEQAGIYYLNNRFVGKTAYKYAGEVEKWGFGGISVEDAGTLYTDFSTPAGSKTHTQESLEKSLEYMKERAGTLLLTNPPAFAVPYADHLIGTDSASSGYDVEDASIPFYQIVFHGLTDYSVEAFNASDNPDKMFLKALEYGSCAYYRMIYKNIDRLSDSRNSDLYYADYSSWLDDAAAGYHTLKTVLGPLRGQYITKHSQLSENVFMTVYEDGTYVVVNYRKTDAETGFGVVKAMDYLSGRGE